MAEAFVRHITDVLTTNKECRVVLGGGRTPVELNRLIVEKCRYMSCNWSGLHIYFSDERIVPEGHPDNTASMIRDTLVIPLGLPLDHIHPISSDLTAYSAADVYHRELTALKNSTVGPLFHLVLLGLGPDGHTASLFPDSPALQERRRLAVGAGKGPEGWERVPLTFPALDDAILIWFVAAGKEKQPVIARIINGPWDPQICPAQGVRPKHGTVSLWVEKGS